MNIAHTPAYELLERKEIPDLRSTGYRLVHKKTGARVMLLENEDKNKVFTIAFRTPAPDSTGVPHILEHTVLCGSRKFPVKDPFIELAKGSLNTFLNAMTYPDKTVYPVASTNDRDFQNLMDVYMDAVLHPNIYVREEIFRQEGWHYELESPEEPITLNGVVYNEMKGAYSSPDDVLGRQVYMSLYPDTQYANESGGDPEVIPTLTYEAFLDMHRRYYHPSNSYIYLYGDCDMEEKLNWLDAEYLSDYESLEIDSVIRRQKPFEEQRYVEKEYPVTEEEPLNENSYLSYNCVIGNNLDPKLYIAFQILEYALLDVPGAPLTQALLDRGIGKDIEGVYENGIYQPYFSVVAKKTDLSRKEAFLSAIREVLENLVKNGLDRKALLAGINFFEFRYREADFGAYPKGLMYGLQAFDSWLYDETRPFLHIEQNATFAALREEAERGYFEKLIQEYLLDNPHSTVVALRPVRGLTAAREKAAAEALAAYKAGLSEEEIQELVERTEALRAYQDEPSTQEELMTIPLLKISDIGKKAEPLVNEVSAAGGNLFLHHNIFTNGISYLTLMFAADPVSSELAPYLGLWKSLLGQLDTEHYSYAELSHEINLESGGLEFSLVTYHDRNGGEKEGRNFRPFLEARGRFLPGKLDFGYRMIPEILFTSKLSDKKRLKEVISMIKSRMEVGMVSAGHSTAVLRASSYFTPSASFMDQVNGITFYEMISDLEEHFEEKAEGLIKKLEEVRDLVLRRDGFMTDFTGSEEEAAGARELSESFGRTLSGEKSGRWAWKFVPEAKNEGFRTSSQVQYVAKAGNFREKGLPYHGSLRVLKVMMGYDYLWQNVRVKGGAYGCMSAFARTGECYMVSYRDPHVRETVEVFDNAPEYIRNFEASDRDMTKYVIGAVGDMDAPLTPRVQGVRSLSAYMGGVTFEELQEERDQVLGTDVSVIRSLAPYAEALRDAGYICAVGGEEKIEENKDLFRETRTLL